MSIFKYFTSEAYAQALIKKGELLLRPLSFFRGYEDGDIRGDLRDGVMVYSPPEGLVITKQDGTVHTLEGWRFTSSAKEDDIFVYCASNQLSAELAKRFESPFCVEIADPDRLLERLKGRAHSSSQLDYEHLVSGKVEYRSKDRAPEADWALPEKLAFIKSDTFAWQDEFRIALGKKGAFDVHNVDCKLESGGASPTAAAPSQGTLVLRTGKMTDFTRLHCL